STVSLAPCALGSVTRSASARSLEFMVNSFAPLIYLYLMRATEPSVAATARPAANTPTTKSLRLSMAASSGGSMRRRDGGEQGVESLGHRRVRENGVAANRVGQPAENRRLHR